MLSSLALAHIRHATLCYLLLHLHTYVSIYLYTDLSVFLHENIVMVMFPLEFHGLERTKHIYYILLSIYFDMRRLQLCSQFSDCLSCFGLAPFEIFESMSRMSSSQTFAWQSESNRWKEHVTSPHIHC